LLTALLEYSVDCSIRVYIDLLWLKSDPAKTGPARPAPMPLPCQLIVVGKNILLCMYSCAQK